MMKKNNIEQTQMDKEQTEIMDKELFWKVTKNIMREREGYLSLPETLEDAIKAVDFVGFEQIHKCIIKDRKLRDAKEEFYFDELGKSLTGYSVGGIGIKSDIDEEERLITVIREFIITPESELLVMESTEKSRYCKECGLTYSTRERVVSENQILSSWEREYIFDKLIRKIKIQDSLNQLEKEILASDNE